MVELDEVIEPSLQLVCSRAQEVVPVAPTPISEEANDNDHETSGQDTTEPRRSTRVRSALEWYGNPVLEVMLLDHDEPTNYEEAFIRFGFELIKLKLFHISVETPNFQETTV